MQREDVCVEIYGASAGAPSPAQGWRGSPRRDLGEDLK